MLYFFSLSNNSVSKIFCRIGSRTPLNIFEEEFYQDRDKSQDIRFNIRFDCMKP